MMTMTMTMTMTMMTNRIMSQALSVRILTLLYREEDDVGAR